MSYKIKIKLADDTVKEFTIGSEVDLPSGLGLTAQQIASLLSLLSSLTALMMNENWKDVEIEVET